MKKARWITIGSIISLAICFAYAPALTKGVRQGLELAIGMFIPSMLPFYFFANFFCIGSAGQGLERLFAPLCKLLRCPKQAASCILMGFLGGYPAGAITVGELCGKGVLHRHTAERLMLFCTNAGPGFVIGAVGAVMLKSLKAGILIYSAQLLASITMAMFSLLFKQKNQQKKLKSKPQLQIGFFPSVSDSVTKACVSCLYAAGFISLASGAASVITDAFKLNAAAQTVVSALFEVTRGCFAISAQNLSAFWLVVLLSCAIGFGGLSVLLQLFSFCGKWVSAKVLIAARFTNAGLSALYAALLCAFFKTPVIGTDVIQTMTTISKGQLPAAFILVAVGFIYCVAKLVEEWYNTNHS